MDPWHVVSGIALLAATALYLGARYLRAPKQGSFRAWGWAGLATILLGESFLFRRVHWVGTFFTPVVWTGYLLFIDALNSSLRGESRLSRAPQRFVWMALWSVPFWLIFEAYNLHLKNWTYIGLPESLLVRWAGYAWSFATIWPAMFETADFVRALGIRRDSAKPRFFSRSSHGSICVLGLLMLTLPLLLPAGIGQYLFGAVWFGFVLLLDPINYRWNGHSFLRDLETGQTSTLWSFLIAGLVCGILWEFWNYWAKAKWLYVFPIWQGAKIFEMPLPGYLGFPAFALECFVMYEFIGTLFKPLEGLRRGSAWRRAIVGTDSAVHPGAQP
jgi:hypothetical protein